MKHQYFGDVDDYIKYGLLRTLAGAGLTVTACWMMTPDDPDPRDGRKLGYLADPAWRVHDPELFDFLRALDLSREGLRRDVSLIERPDLLPSVSPFGRVVPDDRPGRAAYFADLHRLAAGTDVVFFDPDNGFEIASRPRGRRGSSKHLFWDEAAGLYAAGRSILGFQHFARRNRAEHVAALATAARRHTESRFVRVLRSPHVAFLVIGRPEHEGKLDAAVRTIIDAWSPRVTLEPLAPPPNPA